MRLEYFKKVYQTLGGLDVHTDEQGRFFVNHLTSGRLYRATAFVTSEDGSVEAVPLLSAEGDHDFFAEGYEEIELPPLIMDVSPTMKELEGYVLLPDGDPAQAARVLVTWTDGSGDSSNDFSYVRQTDENGYFQIRISSHYPARIKVSKGKLRAILTPSQIRRRSTQALYIDLADPPAESPEEN